MRIELRWLMDSYASPRLQFRIIGSNAADAEWRDVPAVWDI